MPSASCVAMLWHVLLDAYVGSLVALPVGSRLGVVSCLLHSQPTLTH